MGKIFLVVLLLVGCAGPYTVSGFVPDAMNRSMMYGAPQHFGQQPGMMMPTPPPNVGFMYKPPMGWESGDRGFVIFNPESRNFGPNNRHARCWLDGQAIQWIVWGQPQRGYVATATGAIAVPLLAPGQESYHVLDPGPHQIRCEFYVGPAPFKLVAQGSATFDTRRALQPRLSMDFISATLSAKAYVDQ